MLLLKYALLAGAVSLLLSALAVVLLDRRRRPALRLLAMALPLLLASASLVVVPAGQAGVRVSQVSGTRPGTLYPGAHLVKPFLESVVLYDTRDRLLTTAAEDDPKQKLEVLRAQSKEGLAVGLVVSVRFRLDPQRLDAIHERLPRWAAASPRLRPRSSPRGPRLRPAASPVFRSS